MSNANGLAENPVFGTRSIYRAHVKHQWIMQERIYKMENHPARIVNEEIERHERFD